MGDMIARGLAKKSLEKGENLTAQLEQTVQQTQETGFFFCPKTNKWNKL